MRSAIVQGMPTGKSWRFHHWIWRGNAYLDAYKEFSTSGMTWSPDERLLFTYDHLDRLMSAAPESGAQGYSQSFQYNAIGNITTFAGTAYAYNDAAHKHAVTHLGGVQKYWYDLNGNMTTRVEGGTTYSQAWDAENRLTSVTDSDKVTHFTYDGDGVRVRQQHPDNSNTFYVGGVEVKLSGTQRITKTYYTAGAQLVAMRVITSTGGNALYYLHIDHLGGASLTTNNSGGEVARQTYYPYGAIRSGGGMPTDVGFTGQRLDSYIKLIQMGARWYDPELGRWISPDTIVPDLVNPQALNRFAYVANNPLKYIDPSGHCVDNDRNTTRDDQFDCSIEELTALNWDVRSWWIGELSKVATGRPDWFKNIQTVLAFFRDTPVLSDLDGWASLADAPLLWVIQQGWRVKEGKDPLPTGVNGVGSLAVRKWAKFFERVGQPVTDDERFALWGDAETYGTKLGIAYADARGLRPSGRAGELISNFISIGDDYREFLATGECDCAWQFEFYFRFFPGVKDPRTDKVRGGLDYALRITDYHVTLDTGWPMWVPTWVDN